MLCCVCRNCAIIRINNGECVVATSDVTPIEAEIDHVVPVPPGFVIELLNLDREEQRKGNEEVGLSEASR